MRGRGSSHDQLTRRTVGPVRSRSPLHLTAVFARELFSVVALASSLSDHRESRRTVLDLVLHARCLISSQASVAPSSSAVSSSHAVQLQSNGAGAAGDAVHLGCDRARGRVGVSGASLPVRAPPAAAAGRGAGLRGRRDAGGQLLESAGSRTRLRRIIWAIRSAFLHSGQHRAATRGRIRLCSGLLHSPRSGRCSLRALRIEGCSHRRGCKQKERWRQCCDAPPRGATRPRAQRVHESQAQREQHEARHADERRGRRRDGGAPINCSRRAAARTWIIRALGASAERRSEEDFQGGCARRRCCASDTPGQSKRQEKHPAAKSSS